MIPLKKLANGFCLPELGLGCYKMGGGNDLADNSRDAEWIESIRSAIRLGYMHLDTAEEYGAGHGEELVGEAIKDFKREDLVIATKVSDKHAKYDEVLKAAEGSLQRLQTDLIDLYYIHAPNLDVPIQETMRAMDKLVSDGVIKHIGVSNFNLEQMKEAQACSDYKIVANQIDYNLLTRNKSKYAEFGTRNMESEVLPYCQENDIFLVSERPIERGLALKPNLVMEGLSKKYNKTYVQLALNWLISQKNVVAIPKSENKQHQEENRGSVGWYMTDEDVELLGRSVMVDALY